MTTGIIAQVGTMKFLEQLPSSEKNTHFKYVCTVCSKIFVVTGSHLRHQKSCRCQRNVIHGQTDSITYSSWEHMIQRCNNPRYKTYKDYGGRGIRVCEAWLAYSVFVRDVSQRPSLAYTLERLDTNGHYEPGNVVWATRKQQQRNRRDNTFLTFLDKTMTIAEWAEFLGRNETTIRTRKLRGWTDEQALSLPAQRGKKPKK